MVDRHFDRQPFERWFRRRAGPLGLGAVVAVALACEGPSPTEVADHAEAGVAPPEILAIDPFPPGEDPGCPRPCNQDPITGEIVCGDLLDLVTLVDGAPAFFTPPEEACVTRIQNNRRTMNVELLLPAHLVTGERFRFDHDDVAWLCPVPGPIFVPDRLLYTEDRSFRVTPAGELIGKCVAIA